jgi:hypothetical protein
MLNKWLTMLAVGVFSLSVVACESEYEDSVEDARDELTEGDIEHAEHEMEDAADAAADELE